MATLYFEGPENELIKILKENRLRIKKNNISVEFDSKKEEIQREFESIETKTRKKSK